MDVAGVARLLARSLANSATHQKNAAAFQLRRLTRFDRGASPLRGFAVELKNLGFRLLDACFQESFEDLHV